MPDTSPDSLKKARFELLDEPAPGQPRMFEVQFNPSELQTRRQLAWRALNLPGLDAPLLQFVHGHAQSLRLELFFDTTESQTSVLELTRPLEQLTEVRPGLHAPPRFRFAWGEDIALTCVATELALRLDYFNRDGVPLRAHVTLGLLEYRSVSGAARPGASTAGDPRGAPFIGIRRLGPDGEKPQDVLSGLVRESLSGAHFEVVLPVASEYRPPAPGDRLQVVLGYRGPGREQAVFEGRVSETEEQLGDGRTIRASGSCRSLQARAAREEQPVALSAETGLTRLRKDASRTTASSRWRGSVAGRPDLRSGGLVTFPGNERNSAGIYRILSVIHLVDDRGYHSDFTAAAHKAEGP